jgi:hypothetical protein
MLRFVKLWEIMEINTYIIIVQSEMNQATQP